MSDESKGKCNLIVINKDASDALERSDIQVIQEHLLDERLWLLQIFFDLHRQIHKDVQRYVANVHGSASSSSSNIQKLLLLAVFENLAHEALVLDEQFEHFKVVTFAQFLVDRA